MATANSTRRKAGSSLSKHPAARKVANPLPLADLPTLREQAEQAQERAHELNGLVYDHPDNPERQAAEQHEAARLKRFSSMRPATPPPLSPSATSKALESALEEFCDGIAVVRIIEKALATPDTAVERSALSVAIRQLETAYDNLDHVILRLSKGRNDE